MSTPDDTDINPDLANQLPAAGHRAFDMGMGDSGLPLDQTYGKLTVVNRTAAKTADGEDVPYHTAREVFQARGIRYDTVFCTARFWCAGVFE